LKSTVKNHLATKIDRISLDKMLEGLKNDVREAIGVPTHAPPTNN
jgi:hypothetical protein